MLGQLVRTIQMCYLYLTVRTLYMYMNMHKLVTRCTFVST